MHMQEKQDTDISKTLTNQSYLNLDDKQSEDKLSENLSISTVSKSLIK